MSYFYFFFALILSFLFSVFQVHADDKPVINEFLAHPSSGNKEWVEIYVPDGVDITNYWIDDDTDFTSDSGNSTKKQITAIIPGSDSNHVIFELSSSMFNNGGDTVALFAPDGTLVDQDQYTSDPGIDVSIGRFPDVTGNFQLLATATRGSPNSSPKPPDTPTPAPTDKPTKAPKPTETPTPAKSKATSSSSTISTSSQNILGDAITSTPISKNTVSTKKVSSSGAYPTAILGASTKSTEEKVTKPKTQILVKSATSGLPQIIAVSIGGLLLLMCGILLYFKKQGLWFWRQRT